MTIRNLPSTSTVTSSDSVAIDSVSLGGDAKSTLTTILVWLQSQLNATGGFVSLYNTPVTGFSYTVAPPVAGENCYVLLTPAGTLAAGTVVLPTSPVHGQEVLVASTQTITSLTVTTASGSPTTMGASTPWKVRYDAVLGTWNRVV